MTDDLTVCESVGSSKFIPQQQQQQQCVSALIELANKQMARHTGKQWAP